MSLMVSLSARQDAQMTKGEAPRDSPGVCVCEEDSTEHPCFLEPSEPLHDSDRLLDPLFGVQVTRTGVRRGEVAISAQPILDTHTQSTTEASSGTVRYF